MAIKGMIFLTLWGLCWTQISMANSPREIRPPQVGGSADLRAKKDKMLSFANGGVEREIMERCYSVLSRGREEGRWPDVELEDLMAHSIQESKEEHIRMDREGIRGKAVWDFRSHPSNDLGGLISWSIFQAVTANYLDIGPQFSSEIGEITQKYVTEYDAHIWNFAQKIREVEGDHRGTEIVKELVLRLETVLRENPDIHIQVIAELVQRHYDTFGVRAPDAIREYFWLRIQTNLNPANWLNPVRFKDDLMPTPENGYADNNVHKRGDYGKQVAMGNFYNDRGIIFWYTVTGDEVKIKAMIKAWESDPARLINSDYQILWKLGYLRYAEKHPEIYHRILAQLPSSAE